LGFPLSPHPSLKREHKRSAEGLVSTGSLPLSLPSPCRVLRAFRNRRYGYEIGMKPFHITAPCLNPGPGLCIFPSFFPSSFPPPLFFRSSVHRPHGWYDVEIFKGFIRAFERRFLQTPCAIANIVPPPFFSPPSRFTKHIRFQRGMSFLGCEDEAGVPSHDGATTASNGMDQEDTTPSLSSPFLFPFPPCFDLEQSMDNQALRHTKNLPLPRSCRTNPAGSSEFRRAYPFPAVVLFFFPFFSFFFYSQSVLGVTLASPDRGLRRVPPSQPFSPPFFPPFSPLSSPLSSTRSPFPSLQIKRSPNTNAPMASRDCELFPWPVDAGPPPLPFFPLLPSPSSFFFSLSFLCPPGRRRETRSSTKTMGCIGIRDCR